MYVCICTLLEGLLHHQLPIHACSLAQSVPCSVVMSGASWRQAGPCVGVTSGTSWGYRVPGDAPLLQSLSPGMLQHGKCLHSPWPSAYPLRAAQGKGYSGAPASVLCVRAICLAAATVLLLHATAESVEVVAAAMPLGLECSIPFPCSSSLCQWSPVR
jgi:hypothetical protein